MVRRQRQNATEAHARRRHPTQRLERQAAIAERVRMVGMVAEQCVQSRERGVGSCLPQQQPAEREERVGMPGLGIEDRDVEALGLGRIASIARLRRPLESLGHGQGDGGRHGRPCRGGGGSHVIGRACRRSSGRVVF